MPTDPADPSARASKVDVFLLVPGASKAPLKDESKAWWQDGSAFVSALREFSSDRTKADSRFSVVSFDWDPFGPVHTRRDAERRLSAEIRRLRREGKSVCVIAHGDGGNIVYNAMRYRMAAWSLTKPDLRFVSLGTPFKHEYPRSVSRGFNLKFSYDALIKNKLTSRWLVIRHEKDELYQVTEAALDLEPPRPDDLKFFPEPESVAKTTWRAMRQFLLSEGLICRTSGVTAQPQGLDASPDALMQTLKDEHLNTVAPKGADPHGLLSDLYRAYSLKHTLLSRVIPIWPHKRPDLSETLSKLIYHNSYVRKYDLASIELIWLFVNSVKLKAPHDRTRLAKAVPKIHAEVLSVEATLRRFMRKPPELERMIHYIEALYLVLPPQWDGSDDKLIKEMRVVIGEINEFKKSTTDTVPRTSPPNLELAAAVLDRLEFGLIDPVVRLRQHLEELATFDEKTLRTVERQLRSFHAQR